MAKGWSQQRLADAIHMSKMNLSVIERGKVNLNLDHMRRISCALGVQPADLLSDADNPYRLDDQERALLDRLRQADDDTAEQLHQVAGVILPWPAPPPRTGTDDGSG